MLKYKHSVPALLLGTASIAMTLVASQAAMAKEFMIALGGGAGSGQHAVATHFVEQLEAATGGEYSANLFLNSQLGSEQDTVNDAAIGLLDMSVLAINNITPFSPSVGVLTLPYMIQDIDQAIAITSGETAEQLVENTIRDAGVRILAWTYSGFRVLTNSKKPVGSLEDLQDLVIRVPKNEIMIDTYRAWGVDPTPMAWAELFTALQQKVVDGQDLSLIDIESVKFYEVQKYITDIHYNFLLEPLIISEQIFQSQSEEVQQALLEAGRKASAHSVEFLKTNQAKALVKLEEQGMEMTEIDESEWVELATTDVWPKYYDSVGGVDVLNQALTELGRDTVQ